MEDNRGKTVFKDKVIITVIGMMFRAIPVARAVHSYALALGALLHPKTPHYCH
jgi:hypothetical protein